MLSKPESGWTNFELSKNLYSLSYLTDVSIDWLDSAIDGLKNLKPFVVRGFLEPSRMICTVSYWNTHIFVEDDDDEELKTENSNYEIVHINMLDFCKKLYEDINSNLQSWIDWFCDEEIDLNKRKDELVKKLDELKQLIESKKEYFNGSYFFS